MRRLHSHLLLEPTPVLGCSQEPDCLARGFAAAGRPKTGVRVSARRGFTLLELMLAMIIVATLLPVIYSTLHVAFAAKVKAEAAIEPARTAELSLDLLRNDLANALPPTGTLANSFIGTDATDDRGRASDDVIFFTTADAPQDGSTGVNSEIKQVELAVMTTNNGDHVLVRKITRDAVSLLSGQLITPNVEVICRGVGGFNLRYYDGYHWGDTWDSTQTSFNNELPAAVEVTITLDRPNGNTPNADSTRSFKYVRIIPLSSSYAANDASVSTGFDQ